MNYIIKILGDGIDLFCLAKYVYFFAKGGGKELAKRNKKIGTREIIFVSIVI